MRLSDADRAARDLVVSWMRDLGLDIRVDAIGNVAGVWGGREPDAPPVMCGSHIDSVKTGGRYDGAYGVLAGLEVIESLIERGIRTRRPIAVAFFTDEEGARYAPDMLGSLVYVGGMTVEAARDVVGIDGTMLGAELDRIGYAGSLPCPMIVPHAFVELHIEQGPGARSRGFHDRRSHRRARHLVARAHVRRTVESRRHHADGDATRRGLCRGTSRDLRARDWFRRSAVIRSVPSAPSICTRI